MDVQAAPPTLAAGNTGQPTAGNPPVLGQQVPGMTGGLPALSGLSVRQNPMAKELQSYGRGDDTMLVHMTPAEVNSLQGLAMAHGGSLTINPHTGLPEAGWLGKLLPTILGFAGAAFGLPTWALALGGTAAGTAVTGNLGQGLMMGLQAYGGASLAGGLGVGKAGEAAAKLGTEAAAKMGAEKAAVEAARQGVTAAGTDVAAKTVAQKALDEALKNQVTKMPGVFDKFAASAKAGLPGGIIGKAAPYAAGMGLMGAVSDATQPKMATYKPEEPGLTYKQMAPLQRKVRFQTPEQMEASGGAEFQYYTPVNPEPITMDQLQQQQGFAEGGAVSAQPSFEELVASYNAQNPGAITAAMKYPVAAPPTTEQKYNFRPTTPLPPVMSSPIAPDTGGIGGIGFNPIDMSNIDWTTISQNLGLTNIQDQLRQQDATTPDLSGIYGRLDELGSRVSSLPTELPTYQAPDLSGIYGRLDELGSRVQSLPTELPTYQAPDLSGIYGRLDELGSRVQSLPTTLPTYQAPDLSGIYGRLDELGSRVNSLPTTLPTYQAPDLSGIYGRLDELGTKVSSMPTYQAPDLSGIYGRLDELGSKVSGMPTYQAPDLSGIYGRLDELGSKVSSMPTYQAPDLSGIYGRLDELGSKVSGMPTYQAPDFSNAYGQRDALLYYGYARGGEVDMRDGAFVVDARTVSELGNGSSNAGMELLSRMGGQPVRGPGDGVSDSVPASIGGKQEARVARDEVIFQPDAVRRLGGGSEKRGTQKLYALMDKAHKARKKAKRGQDTGVRKGLA